MPAHDPKVRILVVDDQREFADTIADGLCDAGYDAQALGSGRAALARLQAGECDVLITDLRMPDMDGLELVEASRALSKDRPVIVMTAYTAVDSSVESIRRGADHYLTKPFKREELLILLERALDQVRLRARRRDRRHSAGTE
jgi:two-component system response regulator HydG